MTTVLIAIAALLGLAALFGAVLGYASEKFKVEGDPIVEQIDALLPQTQCGQCGHPGCRPYAEAIAEGEEHNRCPPGGETTVEALADLLGREVLPLDNEGAEDDVDNEGDEDSENNVSNIAGGDANVQRREQNAARVQRGKPDVVMPDLVVQTVDKVYVIDVSITDPTTATNQARIAAAAAEKRRASAAAAGARCRSRSRAGEVQQVQQGHQEHLAVGPTFRERARGRVRAGRFRDDRCHRLQARAVS